MDLAVTDVPRSEKQSMRAAMRARRGRVSAAEATRAGERAAELLAERFAALASSLRFALLYAPLVGEVDTAPLDARLRQLGVTVAYPRIAGRGVLALHDASVADLAPGTHGIREPQMSAPVIAPASLDLIVVPGLAFDERGARLGFGGGYYDALLASSPRALRCGLCFSFQLVSQVPVEAHDERLDLIVHQELVVTRARQLQVSKEETP